MKFRVYVTETFHDSFVVEAENEEQAKQIVDDGIPGAYSAVNSGGQYDRELSVDVESV